jgi:hypothetical protein
MKSKTTEMNDIIDSSYTEPDYSHGNGYYDEVNDYRRKNTNTNESATINLFTKITTTRVPITLSASAPNPNPNTSNIFMKYSSDKNNTENGEKSSATTTTTTTTTTTATPNKIKNIEDEFPSLGGNQNKKYVSSAHVNVNAPMNFKKIVETRKTIEVQPQVVQPKPKHDDYYNRFKVYEEVKYYSEKNARSKIYNTTYSDDEDGGEGEGEGEDDDEYYQ